MPHVVRTTKTYPQLTMRAVSPFSFASLCLLQLRLLKGGRAQKVACVSWIMMS